jgi:two-component system KDP operon response regulator KdpE
MALHQNIFLIDDDAQIRRFLKIGLAASNFRVTEARSASTALNLFADEEPALVILDLGLPDKSGLEVLSDIRKISKVPVIILSVRNDEVGKVQAFDLGADDFVTKPFGMAELLARIRTAIRHRLQSNGMQAVMRVGDLEIDLVNHTVRRSGTDIQLTRTELALLRLFVEHSDKVLTHEFILRNLRGHYSEHDSQYLRVYIRSLRNKIDGSDTDASLIHTITGVGYRLMLTPERNTSA